MKKVQWAVWATTAWLGLSLGAVEVDGVVARVNSDFILRSDVQREMRRANVGPSDFERIRDLMIDRKLILKAAADAKMTMQDWVVEDRVTEMVNRSFGGDLNRLKEVLARERKPFDEWRRELKEELIVQAMRWQMVERQVAVSPADLRAEYENNPERYTAPNSVTASVILLKPEEIAKRSEVDAALTTNSFAEVARKYSADAKAVEGGVWKEVDPAAVFRPEVCSALATLSVGETGKWIELEGWSFLLKKEAEKKGQKKTFSEAYDEIEAQVRAAQAKRLYETWLKRLRQEAFVRVN